MDMTVKRTNRMNRTNMTPEIQQLASALVARAALASQMGVSYNGARDLYSALGYPTSISFEQYNGRYTRQDMAKRIVHAFPDACWRKHPKISEGPEDSETDFEKAWSTLVKERHVFHYLHRIDRISGIGRYGVLLIGFDDGKKLDVPVNKANKVIYIRPFHEGHAQIASYVTDTRNARYGLPEFYTCQIPTATGTLQNTRVHHTRILHIADGLTEDDTMGTPRLECIWNRLQDMELISGGSAEMFWRGAFPGIAFEMDKDAYVDDKQELSNEIEEYVHGLKRYLRLQGIKANALAPQITDPRNHLDVQVRLISAATGIPQRILIGSERGELASSQDATAWDDLVEERRSNYVEPRVLRAFIDRLMLVGVLPTVDSYVIKWPALHVKSEKERAEIAALWAKAIADYVKVPGTELVVPNAVFLKKFLEFDQSELEEIQRLVKELIDKEQEDMENERAMQIEDEQRAANLDIEKAKAVEAAKTSVTNA